MDEGDCGAAEKNDIDFTGVYYTTPEVATNWNELWKNQGADATKIEIVEDTQ